MTHSKTAPLPPNGSRNRYYLEYRTNGAWERSPRGVIVSDSTLENSLHWRSHFVLEGIETRITASLGDGHKLVLGAK